jgi:hypothetical protein
MRQRELAERSQVSQAIVRELQRHTVERHRSQRTLEALSVALEWHPGHLEALLSNRKPLEPADTGDPGIDEIRSRLSAIEDHLQLIAERLETMSASVDALTRTDNRGGH